MHPQADISYSEQQYDDTVCCVCARTLPHNPQPNTPQWAGYCSRACLAQEIMGDYTQEHDDELAMQFSYAMTHGEFDRRDA